MLYGYLFSSSLNYYWGVSRLTDRFRSIAFLFENSTFRRFRTVLCINPRWVASYRYLGFIIALITNDVLWIHIWEYLSREFELSKNREYSAISKNLSISHFLSLFVNKLFYRCPGLVDGSIRLKRVILSRMLHMKVTLLVCYLWLCIYHNPICFMMKCSFF